MSDVVAFWRPRQAVRVSGPDAHTFLDGQLSQDLKALAVGDAVDALLLQPQGKVVALLRVLRADDDVYVLETDAGFGTAVVERLERFKLRTKADIDPIEGWQCLAIRGGHAPAGDRSGTVIAFEWNGWSGVDVVGTDIDVPEGMPIGDPDAYEAVRIDAGLPVMGHEITDDTIPGEVTGVVERAVSFTKGCYTGQELVARVDSRGGNVPRRLFGVELVDPAPPAPGAELRTFEGDVAGVVTSAAVSSRTGGSVALAYVPRKVTPPVDIDGGTIKPLPLA